MTVADMLILLKCEHPDRIIVKSKDAEGNGFEEVTEITTAGYVEDGRDSYIGLEALTAEDIKDGYCEDDVPVSQVPAIILW